MVVHLNRQSHILQRHTNGSTNVLQGIHRWNRKIAAFDAGAMALVRAVHQFVTVPVAFLGINFVKPAVQAVAPAGFIKNEKFRFRTEKGRVGYAGRLQVRLRTFCQGTRAAFVALHGGRLQYVTTQIQGRFIIERIHHCRFRVRHQQHIRLIDPLPAGNGRTVKHLAVFEKLVCDGINRHGYMLFLASRITEPQVNKTHLMLFD